MMTLFGLCLLSLAIVGLWSTLRLGSLRGAEWDLMSEYQRNAIMRERHANNPALRRRS